MEADFASMTSGKTNAQNVEVFLFVNTADKNIHAKNAKAVASACTEKENTNAKIVAGAQSASMEELNTDAKIVAEVPSAATERTNMAANSAKRARLNRAKLKHTLSSLRSTPVVFSLLVAS